MKIDIKDGSEVIVRVLEWREDWEFDHPTLILSPVIRYSPNGDSPEEMVESLGVDACVGGFITGEDVSQEFSWRKWSLKYFNRVYKEARNGKKFPVKNYTATEYLIRFFLNGEQELEFAVYERLQAVLQ